MATQIVEAEINRHHRRLTRHVQLWGIKEIVRICRDVTAIAEERIAAERILRFTRTRERYNEW